MERVVVTRTGNDIWSVSYGGRTISVHSTEEQALSAAFALASEGKQHGIEAVVVIAREMRAMPHSCQWHGQWPLVGVPQHG